MTEIYSLRDETTGLLDGAFGVTGVGSVSNLAEMKRKALKICSNPYHHNRTFAVLDEDGKVVFKLRGAPNPRPVGEWAE